MFSHCILYSNFTDVTFDFITSSITEYVIFSDERYLLRRPPHMLPFHAPIAQRLLRHASRQPVPPSRPMGLPCQQTIGTNSYVQPSGHTTLETVRVEQPFEGVPSRNRHVSAMTCISPATPICRPITDRPPLSAARSLMNLQQLSSASPHQTIKRTPSSPVCLPLSTSFASKRMQKDPSTESTEKEKDEASLDWDDMDNSHHNASFCVHTES